MIRLKTKKKLKYDIGIIETDSPSVVINNLNLRPKSLSYDQNEFTECNKNPSI